MYITGLGLGVFGNRPCWAAGAVARAVALLAAAGAQLEVVFVHFREVGPEMRDMLDAAVAGAQ